MIEITSRKFSSRHRKLIRLEFTKKTFRRDHVRKTENREQNAEKIPKRKIPLLKHKKENEKLVFMYPQELFIV